jgi:hypothetical protein
MQRPPMTSGDPIKDATSGIQTRRKTIASCQKRIERTAIRGSTDI